MSHVHYVTLQLPPSHPSHCQQRCPFLPVSRHPRIVHHEQHHDNIVVVRDRNKMHSLSIVSLPSIPTQANAHRHLLPAHLLVSPFCHDRSHISFFFCRRRPTTCLPFVDVAVIHVMSRRTRSSRRSWALKNNPYLPSNLPTSNHTDSPSSPAPASSPASPSSLIHHNRYAPDVDHLVTEIKDSLLDASPDCPLTDVTLQTSDNVDIAASKTMLAIRSNFFKNLFFSHFQESDASQIPVPVRASQLRLVIQFIYTADCSLIHEALNYLSHINTNNNHNITTNAPLLGRRPAFLSTTGGCFPPSSSPEPTIPPRTLVIELIDLSVAADYFHVTHLQQLANETLSALISTFTPITCTALEAMRTYPMALKFCNPLRLWGVTMLNPHGHFLVPDARVDKSPPPPPRVDRLNPTRTAGATIVITQRERSINDQAGVGPFQAHNSDPTNNRNISCTIPRVNPPPNIDKKFGVMELSAETLDSLLRLCTSGSDHEYLFQVIYWWATNGRGVTKKSVKPSVVDAEVPIGQNSSSRINLVGSNPPEPPHHFADESERLAEKVTVDMNGLELADADDEESRVNRWARGKELVKHLSLNHMTPEFIRDFVEQSVLVSKEAVFNAYKYHALNHAKPKDDQRVHVE